MSAAEKYEHDGPAYTTGQIKIVQKVSRRSSRCLVDDAFFSKDELQCVLDRFANYQDISVTISFDEPREGYDLENILLGDTENNFYNDEIEKIMNWAGLTGDNNTSVKDMHTRIRVAMKMYGDYCLNKK